MTNMSKTALTQRMESLLKWKYGFKIGKFLVYEVQFGFHQYGDNKQYVDAALYETNGHLTCFELKATVSDFHSKAKTTFFGHKNYYVMPLDVYEKVKNEIPKEVGIQVLCKTHIEYDNDDDWHLHGKTILEPGESELYTVKKCVSQKEAKVDQTTILWSLLRSMCNRSNRNVENNSVKVDKVIKDHLEIVDIHDREGKLIPLKEEKNIDCPAIQLFVPKEECPEDYETLLTIMKGGTI